MARNCKFNSWKTLDWQTSRVWNDVRAGKVSVGIGKARRGSFFFGKFVGGGVGKPDWDNTPV